MAKTLKQLAQDVLNAQNASNLAGVVRGFGDCLVELYRLVPDASERDMHPIVILWSDAISKLTRTQQWGHERVMQAIIDCRALAARDE